MTSDYTMKLLDQAIETENYDLIKYLVTCPEAVSVDIIVARAIDENKVDLLRKLVSDYNSIV